MAQNLFRDSMVYVNETPWHQLGRQIDAASSSAEFLRAGGLDWNVGLVPAPGAKKDRRGRWSRLQVMRDAVDDETERVALGMVTSRYEPLQNRDAFAFFDPLIRSGWRLRANRSTGRPRRAAGSAPRQAGYADRGRR